MFYLYSIRKSICFFYSPLLLLSPLSFQPTCIDILEDMLVLFKINFCVVSGLLELTNGDFFSVLVLSFLFFHSMFFLWYHLSFANLDCSLNIFFIFITIFKIDEFRLYFFVCPSFLSVIKHLFVSDYCRFFVKTSIFKILIFLFISTFLLVL